MRRQLMWMDSRFTYLDCSHDRSLSFQYQEGYSVVTLTQDLAFYPFAFLEDDLVLA